MALFNLQKDKDKFNKALEKFAGDSFNLHYSLVEATYLFAYLMDDKMKTHYEKIKNLKEVKK